MKPKKFDGIFVTCSKDIEPLLVEELRELGIESREGFRGVFVSASDLKTVYKINYCSRLANRVLMPLNIFRCLDRESLYKGVHAVDWLKYIPKGNSIAIDANVSHRDLRNSLFAAQVAKDAICDQIRDRTGSRPTVNVKQPDIQLNLYVNQDTAVISFDTSKTPLYKRGYRQESMEAPLRESLAAALLRLARYQGTEVMYDPCCGSGTLLIEAALIATKTPPAFLRKEWGFTSLAAFDQTEWLQVKNQADSQRLPLDKGKIFGTDINKNAVHVSKLNLRATGFHNTISVEQYDFRDYTPPIPPNFLICNPPHGIRLEEVQFLPPLYRALGDFMKQKMAKPSKGFVFVGNPELAKEVGLSATKRHVIDNSGIDSRLMEFDIY